MVKLLVVQTGLHNESANAHPERRAIAALFQGFDLCFLTDGPVGAPPVAPLGPEVRGLAPGHRLDQMLENVAPGLKARCRRLAKNPFGRSSQPDFSSIFEPFAKALATHGLTAQDHVLVPDCHPGLLHGLTQFYDRFGASDLPRLHLRFRDWRQPGLYLSRFQATERLSPLVWQGHAALYTETEEHLFYLKATLNLPMRDVLVLPRRISPFDPPVPYQPALPGTAPLVIGVLDPPSASSGGPRLASILSNIARLTLERRGPQSFHFLLAASSADRTTGVYKGLAREGRFGDKVTVEFLPAPLPCRAYAEAMARTDALLLPYEDGSHEINAAGRVLDAVFAGRPLVHTSDMAPQRFLSTKNAIAALSDRDFAKALLALWSHYSTFRAGAEQTRILAAQSLHPAALHKGFRSAAALAAAPAIPMRPAVAVSSRPLGGGVGFIGLG
ncbi:hypothetical protein PUV47_13100 [Pseudovibrio exalbescens]|uniref:hypothetical protein n=1 Tax=Pseudovibrio exalbescens TaxID=197461 RepID=UPI0023671E5C|nr:hypothetical protein [Pseudovibrio exalbescens]MDD7910858.1 hypothetical protein [Pseudovibrio exalbescens]